MSLLISFICRQFSTTDTDLYLVTEGSYLYWLISMPLELRKNINLAPYDLQKESIQSILGFGQCPNTVYHIFIFLHAFWLSVMCFHHSLLQEEDSFRITKHGVQSCLRIVWIYFILHNKLHRGQVKCIRM